MQPILSDHIYRAANLLIDASEEIQKNNKHILSMSPKARIREFYTVKVGSARASGHTIALLKLVKDKRFKNPICIFPNRLMAIHAHEIASQLGVAKKDRFFFHAKKNLDSHRGIDSNAVLIDCCSMISESKLDTIHDEVVLPLMSELIDCCSMISESKLDTIHDEVVLPLMSEFPLFIIQFQ